MAPFPDARPRCVLIIDDDPVFTLLAGETLQHAGFTVPTADTMQSALAAFDTARPDLVLLDVELPDASGFDVCARLRAAAGGVDIPIIMVTGNNDTASIARAYEVGATDFINKPVLWPTLPHRIEFMLHARDNMQALKVTEQKNRALLQALPDSIYILDGNAVILDHIAGGDARRTRIALIGKRVDSILPPDVARAARLAIRAGIEPDRLTTYEFEVGAGDGRRAFEARLRSQADGTFLIVVRDATDSRRAEAQIEYLAYYDTLTGLPNRQWFVKEASRAISSAREAGVMVALLYLDLDRFKRINDNLGHSVGDALLRSVAERLKSSLSSPEAAPAGAKALPGGSGLIARFGGDEFVVLLPEVSGAAHVVEVTNRIQQALEEPFECEGHRFVVTPSIGIALFPQDATNIEDLLIKADMAMYRAKDQGRNGHAFYGESMTIQALGRLELESDLRQAFDNGAFELYYQPKMDLRAGTIVGVEALLRWRHPSGDWIAPDKFIPLAEETGLIVSIGDWVVRETCRQINLWENSRFRHLRVAINVSVQQFAREDFVDRVLRTVSQRGIKPQQLELEITESLLMRNVASASAALKRLNAAGLTVSIDDFGTGYSSLGYLRQFSVDALKIDRSFVKDLPGSVDSAAICAAIIAMARELKLKVIAEGVETEEQLDFLRRHRCDQAQGYLIGKPVSVPLLETLLKTRSPPALAELQAGTRGAEARHGIP